LNGDVAFTNIKQAWERCYYVTGCGVITKKDDKYHLRRITDPVDDATTSLIFDCAQGKVCYQERSYVSDDSAHLGELLETDASLHFCETKCRNTPGCKSFSRCQNEPTGCWMKNTVVNRETAMGSMQPGRDCKTYFEIPCEEQGVRHELATQDSSMCFSEEGLAKVDEMKGNRHEWLSRVAIVKTYTSDSWEAWAKFVSAGGVAMVSQCTASCPSECHSPKCVEGDLTDGGAKLKDDMVCQDYCTMKYDKRYCGTSEKYFVGEGAVDCRNCMFAPAPSPRHVAHISGYNFQDTVYPNTDVNFASSQAETESSLATGAVTKEAVCKPAQLNLVGSTETCQGNERTREGCQKMCKNTPGCTQFDFTNESTEVGCRCGSAAQLAPIITPNPFKRTYCVMPGTPEALLTVAVGSEGSTCRDGFCLKTTADAINQGNCGGDTVEHCMASCLIEPGCVSIEFDSANIGSPCRCSWKEESMPCLTEAKKNSTRYCQSSAITTATLRDQRPNQPKTHS
jgi:hypothetical protein